MLTQPVLLYDGDCGFCRRWIARLERWDVRSRIRCVPAAERSRVPGLPPISETALQQAMHLVTPDGRVHAGGLAMTAMLPYLPGGSVLRVLFRVPGIQAITNRVYRWVAEHRHDLGSDGPSCGLR